MQIHRTVGVRGLRGLRGLRGFVDPTTVTLLCTAAEAAYANTLPTAHPSTRIMGQTYLRAVPQYLTPDFVWGAWWRELEQVAAQASQIVGITESGSEQIAAVNAANTWTTAFNAYRAAVKATGIPYETWKVTYAMRNYVIANAFPAEVLAAWTTLLDAGAALMTALWPIATKLLTGTDNVTASCVDARDKGAALFVKAPAALATDSPTATTGGTTPAAETLNPTLPDVQANVNTNVAFPGPPAASASPTDPGSGNVPVPLTKQPWFLPLVGVVAVAAVVFVVRR